MTDATKTVRTDSAAARFFDRPPPWLGRVIRIATAVELALGALTVILIFALVLLQAGQRYLPIEGWSWTGELARFSLVWLTFVISGVLVTRDSHVAIEMIDMVKNPLVRRIVRVVSCLIVAAVGAGLVVAAWELVQSQGIIKSPALHMPMSWFYAISLIGFVSTTIRALVAAARYALIGVPEPDGEQTLDELTGVSVE